MHIRRVRRSTPCFVPWPWRHVDRSTTTEQLDALLFDGVLFTTRFATLSPLGWSDPSFGFNRHHRTGGGSNRRGWIGPTWSSDWTILYQPDRGVIDTTEPSLWDTTETLDREKDKMARCIGEASDG